MAAPIRTAITPERNNAAEGNKERDMGLSF